VDHVSDSEKRPEEILDENGFSNYACILAPEALIWAVETESLSVVQYILAQGPKVTVEGGYDKLMQTTIESGNRQILKCLLDYGMDFELSTFNFHLSSQWTALLGSAKLQYGNGQSSA
jgi:hypothetical protein